MNDRDQPSLEMLIEAHFYKNGAPQCSIYSGIGETLHEIGEFDVEDLASGHAGAVSGRRRLGVHQRRSVNAKDVSRRLRPHDDKASAVDSKEFSLPATISQVDSTRSAPTCIEWP